MHAHARLRRPLGRLLAAAVLTLALALVVAGAGIGQADPLPSPDAYERVAFVARNDVPFDSLSLGPVAGALGGIVVITPTGSLSDAARQALIDFAPDLVVIAGGTAAISNATAAEIAAAGGWDVVRKSGPSRDETAAEIATLLGDLGVGRPALTGDGQVVGDVRVGGLVHGDTLAVESSDLVANLNADLLDGFHAADFLPADAADGFAPTDLGLRHATLDEAILFDAVVAAPLDVLEITASFDALCGAEDTYHQVLLTANATTSLHTVGRTLVAVRATIGDEAVDPISFAGASAPGMSPGTLDYPGAAATLLPMSAQRYIADLAPGDVTFKLRAALSTDVGTQRIQGARLTMIPLGHTCGAPADPSMLAAPEGLATQGSNQ